MSFVFVCFLIYSCLCGMNALIKMCAAMCAGKLIKKTVCVCVSSLSVWNEAFVCVLMVQFWHYEDLAQGF